jgi:hypothetical protein
MTERVHLDEFLHGLSQPLSKDLVTAFSAMVREPEVAASEYAGRLRAVMDQTMRADDGNASC